MRNPSNDPSGTMRNSQERRGGSREAGVSTSPKRQGCCRSYHRTCREGKRLLRPTSEITTYMKELQDQRQTICSAVGRDQDKDRGQEDYLDPSTLIDGPESSAGESFMERGAGRGPVGQKTEYALVEKKWSKRRRTFGTAERQPKSYQERGTLGVHSRGTQSLGIR